MKVLQINATYGFGSTGNIAKSISDCLEKKGGEAFAAFQYSKGEVKNGYRIGNPLDWKIHALLTRISGKQAYFSKSATRKLLRWIDGIKPDVIHLHNLHANYINLNMLCDYCADNNIPTVLTLHDCWSFTGKCWYFSMAGCDRWKNSCGNCPMLKSEVPSWFFDNTEQVLEDKCSHLNKIPDLTFVGCSDWISDLAKESHLGANRIVTIHNGINTEVFKPTASDFRKKHNIPEENFIILGVSAMWSERKGADVFEALANLLPQSYSIVLVGEKPDSIRFQDRIICIPKTENQAELAEIYSAADLFVNPTREDNFPTVNIEALACGTPVLTFRTGGSPEAIDDTCGSVVVRENIDALEREIIRIKEEKPYSKEKCMKRASNFEAGAKFKEYIELYKDTSK